MQKKVFERIQKMPSYQNLEQILLLFLLVIFGLHQFLKEAELFQVKEIAIDVESPVSYRADGETGSLQICYIKREK